MINTFLFLLGAPGMTILLNNTINILSEFANRPTLCPNGSSSSNLPLVGSIDPQTLGASGTCSDIWGHTSGSGSKYAIIGCNSLEYSFASFQDQDEYNNNPNAPNVFIINVTETPKLVKSFKYYDSEWYDIKTYGSFAYIVVDNVNYHNRTSPFMILDLTNIDDGEIINISTKVNYTESADSHNIFIHKNILYRCALNSKLLVTYDITDPTNPKEIGYFNIEAHDLHVKTINGIDYAFVATGQKSDLTILNVNNPSDIHIVSSSPYLHLLGNSVKRTYSHQVWAHGNYAYLNDEAIVYGGVNITTFVFDISNISNPVAIHAHVSDKFSSSHNMFVSHGVIFQANYKFGVRVYDIEDPVNPQEIGYGLSGIGTDIDKYAPEGLSEADITFMGMWGVYPFFNDTTIIGSDVVCGLYVWNWSPSVLPPSPPLRPICSDDVLVKISTNFTEKCTGHFIEKSFESLDDLCYCLDQYESSPYDYLNCVYSFPGLEPDIDHVVNKCRSRSIRINTNYINGIQEKCCEDDCTISLNKSHYTVVYSA